MGFCARIFPFIKERIGADEAEFGLPLLCIGIGSITSIGYAGVLPGPATIGVVAEAAHLSSAILLLVILLITLPATARRVSSL